MAGAGVLGVVVLVAAFVVHGALTTDTAGASVTHYEIKSPLVHQTLRQTMIVPDGVAAGDTRPLLVMLHGRGEHGEDSFLRDQFFAALAKLGDRAPVVVFPSGDDHSYWHDRADGRWSDYVMREVIPRAVKEGHADPKRVAIGGVSMGGFGALDIARLNPGHFCAVGAHSPALWQTGGETAAGAFDDAADFARNDLIRVAARTPKAFAGEPLWLDAGTSDPFDPGDRAFVAALRSNGVPISVHRWKGGHDAAYWTRHYGAWLRFYADALAHCHR